MSSPTGIVLDYAAEGGYFFTLRDFVKQTYEMVNVGKVGGKKISVRSLCRQSRGTQPAPKHTLATAFSKQTLAK